MIKCSECGGSGSCRVCHGGCCDFCSLTGACFECKGTGLGDDGTRESCPHESVSFSLGGPENTDGLYTCDVCGHGVDPDDPDRWAIS